MASSTQIITLGGGKGGIGKSIMSTNLAVGMALSGQKVVLMDGDFGASNLHALLGISHPPYGFQDLFTNSRLNPESLLIETGIDNLKFISSAGDNPGSANIDPERVQTIISFLKQLKAHTVILDLGPGTSFNVLDFFNIHDQCIVMSTPEVTSVMKTFSFVRAALFRKISLHLKDAPELQRLVDHSHPSQADVETCTIDILRENIKKVDGSQTEEVEKIIRMFRTHTRPSYVNGAMGKSFMNNPQEFQIRFLTMGQSEKVLPNITTASEGEFTANPYLPQIKTCVCDKVTTNYTPQSVWTSYKAGAPIAITMSLSFKEKELVMAKDIEERGGY